MRPLNSGIHYHCIYLTLWRIDQKHNCSLICAPANDRTG